MKSGAFQLKKESIEIFGFCAFLTVLIIMLFPYGKLNLTYDSYDYLAASESLNTYLKGKNQDGFTYLYRAPLLPALLSVFSNKVLAAWWANVLSYCISLFLVVTIAKRLGIKGFFLYGSVIITALSYQWLQNHFFLWTEPLFSILILVLVYCLLENRSVFVVAGICLLLFFLRKAGILFFAAAATWDLTKRHFRNFWILIAVMLLVFLISELVILHFAKTSFFLSAVSLPDDVNRVHYADVLTSWLLPRSIPLLARTGIVITTLLIVSFVFTQEIVGFIRNERNQVLITVTGVYLLSIIIFIGSRDYYEAERFLSVVVPVWTLLLFAFCQGMVSAPQPKRTIFIISVSLWVLYPISRTIYHFLQAQGLFNKLFNNQSPVYLWQRNLKTYRYVKIRSDRHW